MLLSFHPCAATQGAIAAKIVARSIAIQNNLPLCCPWKRESMNIDIRLPMMKPSTAEDESVNRSRDDAGEGCVNINVVAAMVNCVTLPVCRRDSDQFQTGSVFGIADVP